MDRNDRSETRPTGDAERSATRDHAPQPTTGGDSRQAAPPGSSEIDSTGFGQAVADNPALRARRDADDILADQVREEGEARGDESRNDEPGA